MCDPKHILFFGLRSFTCDSDLAFEVWKIQEKYLQIYWKQVNVEDFVLNINT